MPPHDQDLDWILICEIDGEVCVEYLIDGWRYIQRDIGVCLFDLFNNQVL